jgi:uncharacterized membrane protein
MMAMTTSSSIKVKAPPQGRRRLSLRRRSDANGAMSRSVNSGSLDRSLPERKLILSVRAARGIEDCASHPRLRPYNAAVPNGSAQRIPAEAMRHVSRRPGSMPPAWAQVVHRPVFLGFSVSFAVCWGAMVTGLIPPDCGGWLDGLILVLGTVTTLLSIARRLPLQNVLACGVVVISLCAVAITLGVKTSAPFGFFHYTDRLGPRLLDTLTWPAPLLWLVLLLNSRGVAKLMLRPRRRQKQYGVWLICLTAVLVVVADFGLEPFAVYVKKWWQWNPNVSLNDLYFVDDPREVFAGFSWYSSKLPVRWYDVPWANFVGWLAVAALIVAFVTPWLVRRRSSPQPTDFHPLAMWLLMNLYFATGNALYKFWPAVTFTAVAGLLVGSLSWLYGRPLLPPPGTVPPVAPPGPPAAGGPSTGTPPPTTAPPKP